MIDAKLTPAYVTELDTRATDWLRAVHGEPWIETEFTQPFGHWRPGDGRPELVADTPAVAQAIGRCVAFRTRVDGLRALPGSIHPAECGWCGWETAMLLRTLDYAIWQSQFVMAETLIWEFLNGRYLRASGRGGTYLSPAWADFFRIGETPSDQAHLRHVRLESIARAAAA